MILLLAGCALGIVAAGDGTIPGDLAVMLAMQQPMSAPLDRVAWTISRLGDTSLPILLLTFALSALFLLRDRIDLALLFAAALALRVVGTGLKRALTSPRPTADLVSVLDQAGGFGYPSGHALGAALFYGTIAIAAPQVSPNTALVRAIRFGAAAIILLTAWSRVRLGVHWPSDVLGGVLIGFGLVCLLQAVWLVWHSGRVRT